jgi:hypothetical protein
MAGRTTLYHHAEAPFYKSMKNMTRLRRVDPAQHTAVNLGQCHKMAKTISGNHHHT